MKRCSQLEKEKYRLEQILGLRLNEERKRFSERAAKLGKVCKDLYDFILHHPGLTTKEIQNKWPHHKYGYQPTTFDNRIRDLRTIHPEWGWEKPLVVSIVEDDGLQHHYPAIQNESRDEG